jgi:hypothetical protein
MRVRIAVGLVFAALFVAGCSQAEDVARDTADQVASAAASRAGELATEAASKAGQAATDAVRRQVCEIAADGKVSEEEAGAIRSAADAADRAGVPQEIVDAARAVADAGPSAPPEAVDRLRQECAR